MIVMYESNPSLKLKVEKTERVPDEEFILIKRRAVVFLKAKQYSVDVIKHFEETPYELWVQTASDGKKRYMLWWDATIAEYVEMERRLQEESYFQQVGCVLSDAENYCLGLGAFLPYIQRRQSSGNTPVLPNKPANMPNRMAVPTTKMQTHPIHNAENIMTSTSGYSPGLLEARIRV
jgi:hypothetical protein